jgi:hypothetical protein
MPKAHFRLLALNTDSVYVRVPLEGPTQMLPGAEMIHLRRQELDVWLGEPDDFVLAVLRDLYEHETDVERWLNMPHDEFGGRSAVDLLSAGHVGDVEALLVEQWNAR